ncbi:hypothetical protein [Rossellomorea sp. RS05]|uniref:hypothetical protein n=1 Tax=Rossellomorea sp. RS05 TaxID=3149166 RepID=UPI003221A2F7
MERRALDSNGNRGKIEIPQAQPRKLDFLPVESKCPKRNGTVYFLLIPQSLKGTENDLPDILSHSRGIPAHPIVERVHNDQPPKSGMKRRALDSYGKRGMIETPQACVLPPYY